MQPLELMSA